MGSSAYGQYRDPNAGNRKEKKEKKGHSDLDKQGLFGFRKNGAFKKQRDPFLEKQKKREKPQYKRTPPDRKKPRRFVLFKNKKDKPPKISNKKLKEKDSFSTKEKGRRYNKDYSKYRKKNKPKKKKKDRKLYKKT